MYHQPCQWFMTAKFFPTRSAHPIGSQRVPPDSVWGWHSSPVSLASPLPQQLQVLSLPFFPPPPPLINASITSKGKEIRKPILLLSKLALAKFCWKRLKLHHSSWGFWISCDFEDRRSFHNRLMLAIDVSTGGVYDDKNKRKFKKPKPNNFRQCSGVFESILRCSRSCHDSTEEWEPLSISWWVFSLSPPLLEIMLLNLLWNSLSLTIECFDYVGEKIRQDFEISF